MNQIYLNMTYNHMNAIYVDINVGQGVSPLMATNVMAEPKPSRHLSPSLSTSSLSSSSESLPSFLTQTSNSCGGGQVIPKGLANNSMFDPIRYKTEMCKNLQELGNCKFGEKCYYAHFSHELKVATYKHKNYKTQLCKPYHSDGLCDFGWRCAFIHSKPNIDQILSGFQSFLSSALPMPDIRAEEELIGKQELKPKTEKRLKVFENMSSK